jgi:hypothetical protein
MTLTLMGKTPETPKTPNGGATPGPDTVSGSGVSRDRENRNARNARPEPPEAGESDDDANFEDEAI